MADAKSCSAEKDHVRILAPTLRGLAACRAFVLFNLYGPAISNEDNAEERFAYKLRFYQARLLAS